MNVSVDASSLVDVDKGLVSRRIFVEEEIYQLELERIFARCWLFLGHEQAGEVVDGRVTSGVFSTEQNQRGMYRQWAELMDAKSWGELLSASARDR